MIIPISSRPTYTQLSLTFVIRLISYISEIRQAARKRDSKKHNDSDYFKEVYFAKKGRGHEGKDKREQAY